MEEKDKLCCRIHTRLTRGKYRELKDLLCRSRGIRTLSELLRNILDDKTVVISTRDETLDKVMTELSMIRTELQAIGVNINQVTRRFHRTAQPEEKLLQAMGIVKLYQQTDQKVTKLFSMIAELSELWLPK